MHFWSFWAKYRHYCLFFNAPPKNTNKVPRWVFRYVGNKTFDFSRKNQDFCPKLAFLFILGQALLDHLVPCWWIGWWLWRAGWISQDTLYFILAISGDFLYKAKTNFFRNRFPSADHLIFNISLENMTIETEDVVSGFFSLSIWSVN